MFKYFILFLSLLTLASCTKTEATPSNAMKQTENTSIPSKQTLLYVDVREDEEWAAGHIEWAMHVKLGDIEAGNFSAIPKDTPVALYCRSGRRSAIAHGVLKNAGYTNITDVWGMESVRGVKIVR
jgi:phage shock protein E